MKRKYFFILLLIVLMALITLFIEKSVLTRLYLNSMKLDVVEIFSLDDDVFAKVGVNDYKTHHSIIFRCNYKDFFNNKIFVESINDQTLATITCLNNSSPPDQTMGTGLVFDDDASSLPPIKISGINDLINKINIIDSLFKLYPEYPLFYHKLYDDGFELYQCRVNYKNRFELLKKMMSDSVNIIFKSDECNCRN